MRHCGDVFVGYFPFIFSRSFPDHLNVTTRLAGKIESNLQFPANLLYSSITPLNMVKGIDCI